MAEPTDSEWAEALAWMRSRPPEIQVLMRRLPPSCLVRSAPGHTHTIPAPGRDGKVVSYFENGLVSVMHTEPSFGFFGPLRGQCKPEDLVVVGYYQSPGRPAQDEAWVARVLDGLDG